MPEPEDVPDHDSPEARELPDPIQVLQNLFEASDLEDCFYAIREREEQGFRPHSSF